MTHTVSLPLWLVVLLAVLAAWAALDRLLVPSVRFVLRRRVNRVLDEINTRLRIRVQPFKLTKRQVLVDRLVFDPAVLEAAEAHARDEDMPREVAMEKVKRYADEIVPAFNAYVYFRLGYRLARAVARTLYRVRLGASDEAALAEVDPKATVVFVMNHRSNMDYVLVSYLVADATALSYAVGEWARIWPLQTLIRSMGAYFVRRRSRNPLYRRVLERYVHMATASGVTQAVYPEGGLSRDGRLGAAKLGLLDYMLRDFDPEGPRDLVFVPVGLNYDRVIEDRTLLLDLDPGAPRAGGKKALATALRFVGRNLSLMARSRWYRLGYACVSFGVPISARRYLAEHDLDLRRLDREDRFAEVERLAGTLMDGIGRAVPAVPAAVAATVFLERLEEGGGTGVEPMPSLEYKARVYALQEELRRAGGLVYLPRDDPEYAAEVGLRMLKLRRAVVDDDDGRYRPLPEERRLFEYYAHSIAHLRKGGAGVPSRAAGHLAAPAGEETVPAVEISPPRRNRS